MTHFFQQGKTYINKATSPNKIGPLPMGQTFKHMNLCGTNLFKSPHMWYICLVIFHRARSHVLQMSTDCWGCSDHMSSAFCFSHSSVNETDTWSQQLVKKKRLILAYRVSYSFEFVVKYYIKVWTEV